MAQISDFKIEQSRDKRLRQIEEINSLFDVEFEEVRNAADAAGMRMSLEGMTYYFFAECVSEGKEMKEELDENVKGLNYDMYEDELMQRVDRCIPLQSYVAMYIWVDCGYDTSGIGVMDDNNIVRFAQLVLYEYAQQAIIHAFED